MRAVVDASRATEWWEYKLAPILATGYATAFLLHVSLIDAGPGLLLVFAALAPGALFVSVVNDLTDLAADRAAGKRNRLAGRSRPKAIAAVGACLAVGLGVALLAWRGDPLVLALYAGAWIAFSLYSIPPARLKGRGFAGVLADAAGAHVFPQLLIVVVVFRDAGRVLDARWLVIVGIWSLALGLRGALGHQLGDIAADERAGLRSFARAHTAGARALGAYAVFPVELLAFGAVLLDAGCLLAFLFLPVYVVVEALRIGGFGVHLIAVSPAPRGRIAMQEYYVVLFPLAFLIAATAREAGDGLVLLLHVALFPQNLIRMLREARWAVRALVRPRFT